METGCSTARKQQAPEVVISQTQDISAYRLIECDFSSYCYVNWLWTKHAKSEVFGDIWLPFVRRRTGTFEILLFVFGADLLPRAFPETMMNNDKLIYCNLMQSARITYPFAYRAKAKVDQTYKNKSLWCKLSIQAAASMASLG